MPRVPEIREDVTRSLGAQGACVRLVRNPQKGEAQVPCGPDVPQSVAHRDNSLERRRPVIPSRPFDGSAHDRLARGTVLSERGREIREWKAGMPDLELG